MGAALSFLGQQLFASSTREVREYLLLHLRRSRPPAHHPSNWWPPMGMTTIHVDSRKRVAGLDSDFEVDLGESLHLQSDARLAVYKIRLADSTSTGLTPRWAR